MTAITDAKLIIETALGHSVTTAALMRIANAYATTDPHSLADFADPENPTNEEKAQLYIDTLLANGWAVVRSHAEGKEQTIVDGQVSNAGDTAVADLT